MDKHSKQSPKQGLPPDQLIKQIKDGMEAAKEAIEHKEPNPWNHCGFEVHLGSPEDNCAVFALKYAYG